MPNATIGISLKMYFRHEQAVRWFGAVRGVVSGLPAITSGAVELFVVPTFVQLPDAVAAFAGTGVGVGAQDVSAADSGAFTGEVSASELAELGVAYAEIGHAERRRRHGETDAIVAWKATQSIRRGLVPVICVGESGRSTAEAAAAIVSSQLRACLAGVPAGRVIIAYEPVWAIGAARPAAPEHVAVVASALRSTLASLPDRTGSSVIYGGSAGPGLLGSLRDSVDGLFLGRFAHDPVALADVVAEAAGLLAIAN